MFVNTQRNIITKDVTNLNFITAAITAVENVVSVQGVFVTVGTYIFVITLVVVEKVWLGVHTDPTRLEYFVCGEDWKEAVVAITVYRRANIFSIQRRLCTDVNFAALILCLQVNIYSVCTHFDTVTIASTKHFVVITLNFAQFVYCENSCRRFIVFL